MNRIGKSGSLIRSVWLFHVTRSMAHVTQTVILKRLYLEHCDVPTTLLLYNCVFAYVNDKFTYFFVCALLFGFLMIEPLLR